jgi:hypothetical protein
MIDAKLCVQEAYVVAQGCVGERQPDHQKGEEGQGQQQDTAQERLIHLNRVFL